ncbi:hypothetical protein BJX62DRAFT_183556 [Aspergillus germanicus]
MSENRSLRNQIYTACAVNRQAKCFLSKIPQHRSGKRGGRKAGRDQANQHNEQRAIDVRIRLTLERRRRQGKGIGFKIGDARDAITRRRSKSGGGKGFDHTDAHTAQLTQDRYSDKRIRGGGWDIYLFLGFPGFFEDFFSDRSRKKGRMEEKNEREESL